MILQSAIMTLCECLITRIHNMEGNRLGKPIALSSQNHSSLKIAQSPTQSATEFRTALIHDWKLREWQSAEIQTVLAFEACSIGEQFSRSKPPWTKLLHVTKDVVQMHRISRFILLSLNSYCSYSQVSTPWKPTKITTEKDSKRSILQNGFSLQIGAAIRSSIIFDLSQVLLFANVLLQGLTYE
jgi:hypothetical protein